MGQLEIACFNLASALIAQENDADRIELCDGFEVGGTTPSMETVFKIKEFLSIDLYVMIRPRGGNFVYTDDEFLQMKTNVSNLCFCFSILLFRHDVTLRSVYNKL